MVQIPLELYKQIHASIPIPCVDAVICHEGRVFLCMRVNRPAQGLWWFPGGRIMKGELLEDAVRRKVKEETGFEVATIESLGTEETLFPDGPFEKPTHTINVVFRTTLLSPETTGEADAQHAKMQWFKELPDNLHPYIRKYIERALQAGT